MVSVKLTAQNPPINVYKSIIDAPKITLRSFEKPKVVEKAVPAA